MYLMNRSAPPRTTFSIGDLENPVMKSPTPEIINVNRKRSALKGIEPPSGIFNSSAIRFDEKKIAASPASINRIPDK